MIICLYIHLYKIIFNYTNNIFETVINFGGWMLTIQLTNPSLNKKLKV